jgi:hypothetical protein
MNFLTFFYYDFQEKKHGSGESDHKKVMVKVGNKTKHTGGTGGKKSVASANLVRSLKTTFPKYIIIFIFV